MDKTVANLRVNQRSQINEDTVEPSLAAQDINPIAFRTLSRIRTLAGTADGQATYLA